MIQTLFTVKNNSGSTLDTTEESPLDVLSRAATMVQQEGQQVGEFHIQLMCNLFQFLLNNNFMC